MPSKLRVVGLVMVKQRPDRGTTIDGCMVTAGEVVMNWKFLAMVYLREGLGIFVALLADLASVA